MRRTKPTVLIAPFLAAALMLAGCQSEPDPVQHDEPVAEESPDAGANAEEPISILRSEGEQAQAEKDQELEPLNVTIGFPDGGADLSADAVAALEGVLASDQLAKGAPITLRAHSDSGGSDAVNARASEARGLAVAAWLIDNGIADDRINVIVFGEQNPIEPNALPNGEPNEEGRAANRRVEVMIVPGANATGENAGD